MTDLERYDDPALARRFRAWAKAAAPTAAPERLVYAVMDEVERVAPRRVGLRAAIRLQSFWQYVALTMVIAIGVAAGTLVTRQGDTGSSPTAGPTTSPAVPSASPAPWPSLQTIERYELTGPPGPSAIGIDGSSLWVGRPDGSIVELNAATGDELGSVSVGAEPMSITLIDGLLWVGSGSTNLAWVDPVTRDVGTITGAGGPYVLPAAGAYWVSAKEKFLRVDPASGRILGSIPIAGHAASEPGLRIGDELWAASGPDITRVALPSGAVLGTIPVHASVLVQSSDGVWAIDRGVLLRVAAGTMPLETPIPILDSLLEDAGAFLAGDRLWVYGPVAGRPAEVVEIDLAAGRIVSRTALSAGPRGLAVVGGSVWVSLDSGALVRLQAGS
jgi:hypothetical protein